MNRFYIGTYTSGSESRGIYAAQLDPQTGAMKIIGFTESDNPSFAALNKAGTRLYTVNEKSGANGNVSSYSVEASTGALTFLGSVSSRGVSPCYIGLDLAERAVIVTNYSSGTVPIYPLDDQGVIREASMTLVHEGHGADPDRQSGPHAHSFILDPRGQVIVADLGLDKLMIYSVDHGGGAPSLIFDRSVDLHPGAGPRHMAFDKSYKRLYVLGELDATVTVFDYDEASGLIEPIQSLSALPAGYKGKISAADIHLSDDGCFLYTSNRGDDSVAVFAVEPDSGKLEFIKTQSVHGKTPRNFAIDPGGRWLLCANQDSDNIVCFSIDRQTGLLSKVSEIAVPRPVMVLFY